MVDLVLSSDNILLILERKFKRTLSKLLRPLEVHSAGAQWRRRTSNDNNKELLSKQLQWMMIDVSWELSVLAYHDTFRSRHVHTIANDGPTITLLVFPN